MNYYMSSQGLDNDKRSNSARRKRRSISWLKDCHSQMANNKSSYTVRGIRHKELVIRN